MAWIQSHQEIRTHPKTEALADELEISIPSVVGHLHLFWLWCLSHAEDGDITKYTPRQIARAAMWEGKADSFLQAMITCGLIDTNGDTRSVHDWKDYGGKLIERRRADLLRKQGRIPPATKQVPTEVSRNSKSVQQNSNGKIENSDGNFRREDKSREDKSREEENISTTTQNLGLSSTAESGDESDQAPESGSQKPKPRRYTDREGSDLYTAYPRKTGRRDAISAAVRALQRIARGEDPPPGVEVWPPPDPFAWLLDRVKVFAKSARGAPPASADDDYRPHPATWFNQARYCDDEAEWNAPNGTRSKQPQPSASQRHSDDWGAEFDLINSDQSNIL